MEHQIPLQFPAIVQYWTEDGEVQKVEVVRSCAHGSPYLDVTQYPHLDFSNTENRAMQNARTIISERLNALMRANENLNTNQAIENATRHRGRVVSKNTVMRLRKNIDHDVGIENVEAVAAVFGLTLAEFVSPPGKTNGMNSDEMVLLQKYRQLKSDKDRQEILLLVTSKQLLNKLLDQGSDPE